MSSAVAIPYNDHRTSYIIGSIILILGLLVFIYVSVTMLGTPSCQAHGSSGCIFSVFTCCGNCGQFWSYFLATIFIGIGAIMVTRAYILTTSSKKLVNKGNVECARIINPPPQQVVIDASANNTTPTDNYTDTTTY